MMKNRELINLDIDSLSEAEAQEKAEVLLQNEIHNARKFALISVGAILLIAGFILGLWLLFGEHNWISYILGLIPAGILYGIFDSRPVHQIFVKKKELKELITYGNAHKVLRQYQKDAGEPGSGSHRNSDQ